MREDCLDNTFQPLPTTAGEMCANGVDRVHAWYTNVQRLVEKEPFCPL